MKESQLAAACEAFAEAPFDDSRWLPALGRMAALTGSARGELIACNGADLLFNFLTDVSEEMLREFVDIDGGNMATNWRLRSSAGAPPMKLVWERDYEMTRAGSPPSAYDDYGERHDMIFGCQAPLVVEPDLMVGLAVLRTERDGPTTPEQRRFFAMLAPFVRMATRTALLLEQQGARLVAGTLEAMSLAALVCDGSGAVRSMTPAAEQLLTRSSALRVAGGAIRCRRSEDEAAVGSALRRAIGDSPGAGRSSTLVVERGDIPRILSFVALPAREWSFGFQPRALVVIRVNHDETPLNASMLRALYGLTPAEAEIVLALLAGRSRRKIAEIRKVTQTTVESQLKAIYQKMDVTREIELFVKLRAFAGIL